MPVRIEAGYEPIPGYRLIERLGSGGFGEVWKAEVPGGLFKAMKFVFGDLQGAGEDSSRAEQELKALSRVKTVHHPYILSLERFDIIDGQLIIVMELADRTVWDRFRECRQQGLPGIPRDELLNYMQEAAEALDLMNGQFQLQHLDIKPQNLFLVFNHVKVADFGLVKDLGNMAAATITGGVTPVYAAPETFDGWLSRFSDQYSLAIVYQELLTGVRPFAGNTMRQLVLQHLQSPPNVSSLAVHERAVITRALAKNPDERYPSCLDMVHALRDGIAKAFPSLPAAPVHDTAAPPPMAQDPSALKSSSVEVTWNARKGLNPPPPGSTDAAFSFQPPSSAIAAPPPADMLSSLTRHTPREPISRPPSEIAKPRSRPTPGPRSVPRPVVTPTAESEPCEKQGTLQPTLLFGIGQLGLETLQQFRRILSQEFGHFEAVPHLRMLGLDTDAETIKNAGAGDPRAALRPSELLLTRLQRANQYLAKMRGETKLPTDNWLNQRLLYRIPRDNAKAPVRALGRFAFSNNVALISRRLHGEIQACASDDTLHDAVPFADLGIRNRSPRVFIIANLAGATGSGAFLDAAYLVRSHLRQLGLAKSEVVGIFFLPSTGPAARPAALANSYAALAELNFFIRNDGMKAQYASFENKDVIKLDESGPPFHRCYFLGLDDPLPASEEYRSPDAVHLAAQFLYRDLVTPLGKALDSQRKRFLTRSTLQFPKGPLLETFGLHRVSWPRRELQQRLAERFCTRLVERWKTKNSAPLAAGIAEWIAQQWEALEMRPENLITRHQELLEKALRGSPDKAFQDILQPFVQAVTASKHASAVQITPAVVAMERLEQLLGVPDLARDASHRNAEPAHMEQTLREVSSAVADQCDTRLAELVVSLIENPQYRLAGAEEALRRLNAIAEEALKVQETLAKELSERAAALYRRIHDCFDRIEKSVEKAPSGSSSHWFSRKSATGNSYAADLLDLLRIYPKAQYQALLLSCINRLYISMRGHLSDQLREVGFCRQRLEELSGLFLEKKAPVPHGSFEKFLLPPGNDRVDDVLTALEGMLVEDDYLAFDERVQAHIRKQYKALLNVCLGPTSVVRALSPVMLQEAESYLDLRFPPPSIVELFQAQGGGDTSLETVLSDMFDEAAPDLPRLDPAKEVSLVSLPADHTGQALVAAASHAIPETVVVPSERCEEIVIYREQLMTSLTQLSAMGPAGQQAYSQRQAQDPSSVHSREDIADWDSASVGCSR